MEHVTRAAALDVERVTAYADPMTPKRERQIAYRERLAAKGLAQIAVVAPARDKERVRRYAEGLVKALEKEQAKEAKSEG